MRLATGPAPAEPEPVLSGEEITALQWIVRRIAVAEHVFVYARAIVRASRPQDPTSSEFVKKFISWGGGPRASLGLILAGKARAAAYGRPCVSVEDIDAVAPPVLRHRLILNFEAQSEGLKPADVIRRLLQEQAANRA